MVNQKQITCRGDYAFKYTKSICIWVLAIMFSVLAASDFYNFFITFKEYGLNYTYWYIQLTKIVAFVCICVGLVSTLVQKKDKSVANLHCLQVGLGLRVVSLLALNILQYCSYIQTAGMYYRNMTTYLFNEGKIYDIIIDLGIVLSMVFAGIFVQNIIKSIKKDANAPYIFSILCGVFCILILPLIVITILSVFKTLGAELTFENILKVSSIPSFIRLYGCAIIGVVAGVCAFRWIGYAKKINNFVCDDVNEEIINSDNDIDNIIENTSEDE